jgi:DNA helicase-2/ATP-dependent DNA helicase PcrA
VAEITGRCLGDIAILYKDYRAGNIVAEAVIQAGYDYIRVDTAAPYHKVALISWIEDCAAWCAGGWREARPQLRGLLDRGWGSTGHTCPMPSPTRDTPPNGTAVVAAR